MELSSSQTSLSTEDYTLITHEKCNPPRAKLFIVFLVSLVIATVIVLLVVLTRLDPLQDTSSTDPEVECADIAIIGAGVAGTYAAWRLRDINQSVILYEMTSRPGGRFHSIAPESKISNVQHELGASFFIPSLNPLMNETIAELGLDIMPLINLTLVHYMRGQFMDLRCDESCPYAINGDEAGKSPLELLRIVLGVNTDDSLQGAYESGYQNITDLKEMLNKQRLRDLVLARGSYETYNYLRNALCWWEYHPFGNAQAFFDYVIDTIPADSVMAERMTIAGGMDNLIDRLISSTRDTNERFSVVYDRKLMSIDSLRDDFSYFQFGPSDGATDEELHSCARTVILAIPPDDVIDLGVAPKQLGDTWRTRFNDVIKVPYMRVLVEYNSGQSLFSGVPPWGSVMTDLPINDIHIVDDICETRTTLPEVTNPQFTDLYTEGNTIPVTPTDDFESYEVCTTMLQINLYGEHLAYWINLLISDGYDLSDSYLTTLDMTSSTFGRQLTRYLEEILRTNGSLKMDINSMTMHAKLWSSGVSTPAFYIWKPSVDWEVSSGDMMTPMHDIRLYLVGSAYAPSYQQYWAEGALISVDKLLSGLSVFN